MISVMNNVVASLYSRNIKCPFPIATSSLTESCLTRTGLLPDLVVHLETVGVDLLTAG